ncbi:hypothetical protein HJC23_011581 [Cyclotella cryptica]|uniref:Uncharacterized protein n=1 Tax=Cyclotella cryptica TaxID=29204 RepID=A0ABD3QRH8_9STRA|eukprot:CCRYP_002686-RA/>CCRYP_002686-RA protein AED:0.04 eAED:0.04 QI:629/-1/1/1/-1/1/1/296/717
METIAINTAAASEIATQFRKRSSSVTITTLRSSLFTSCTNNDNNSLGSCSFENMGNGYENDRLPDLHVLRRGNNGTPTAPTMFSVVSHSDRSSNRTLFRRETATSSSASRGSSLLRFFSARRARQLSEAQLRKKVSKLCDRGDWSRVRKLISNHDFADVAEVIPETNSVIAKSSSSEGKHSLNNELIQNPNSRRPSYGSRNGERLSFAGKESAAAAAVIKAAAAAAMLEEGSKSEDCSDNADMTSGENILHDVCRHNPPLDVIELLLTALRHRRGITCARDDDGRTPLHVAVASGASSVVVDALAMADPVPASMGDGDNRSPLHLAVKFLAYKERSEQHSQALPRLRSTSSRASKIAAIRKGKRKNRNNNSNTSILLIEKELCEARQIVMILKNAMITYPGQIDFKDEDNTGFAPLDYAIDGSITDQAILHLLIRRNKSQDLCRQSTLRSEDSDVTHKTRNGFTVPCSEQASLSSVPSNESPLSHRCCGRSSVSTRNSVQSQDSTVLRQIEEEEMSARRHRINRIKARDQKMYVEEGLFNVFGIEESVTPEQSAVEVDGQSCPGQIPMSGEEQKETANFCDSDVQLPCKSTSAGEQEDSATTREAMEPSLRQSQQQNESPIVSEQGMTAKDIYNFHLQAYLADTLQEFLGDLEYCDDLDFLYDDPDEMDEDTLGKISTLSTRCVQEHRQVPVFEVCVEMWAEDSSIHSDDCSEITSP